MVPVSAVSEKEWDGKSTTRAGSSPSETSHPSSNFSLLRTSGSRYIPSSPTVSPWSTLADTLSRATEASKAPIEVGWPRLARKMVDTPAYESFSRFRELNVKNLLYYQVEIAELESDLRKAETNDSRRDHTTQAVNYATDAEMMLGSKDEESLNAEEKKQCELVFKIRERLREYNAALLQYAQISALAQPDPNNVEALRVWIKREGCGHDAIAGESRFAWGDFTEREEERGQPWKRILPVLGRLFWPRNAPPHGRDLIRTQHCAELDTFTRWIKQEFMPLWHDIIHCRDEVAGAADERYGKAKTYTESTMLKFTAFVAMVVACVLPTVAVGILSTTKTIRDRLLYIGGFTMLFAIGLLWLTDVGTSRIQIFTATATFSAVLVVFVQNQ